eukprot:24401-Eustigmatos_ZCMA.PRE.1
MPYLKWGCHTRTPALFYGPCSPARDRMRASGAKYARHYYGVLICLCGVSLAGAAGLPRHARSDGGDPKGRTGST